MWNHKIKSWKPVVIKCIYPLEAVIYYILINNSDHVHRCDFDVIEGSRGKNMLLVSIFFVLHKEH